MQLGKRGQVCVKFFVPNNPKGAWVYYKAERSRDIYSLMRNFRGMPNFICCYVFEWLGKRGKGSNMMDASNRGNILLYFDRYRHDIH